MSGRTLYEIWCHRAMVNGLVVVLDWLHLSPYEQIVWDQTAFEIASVYPPEFINNIAPDWKFLLQKYGRHTPGCPIGACSCGFDAIEKALAG